MNHPTKFAPLVETEALAPASTRSGATRSGKPGPGKPKQPRGLRSLTNSTAGKILGIAFCIGVMGFAVWRSIPVIGAAQEKWPRVRIMNSDTGELRWYRVGENKKMPEGFYYVEYCFENTCGPAGGTPVVLNIYRGSKEPTKCPKCGARVVGHNPRPPEYVGVIPLDQKD